MRQEFSRKTKRDALIRCGEECEECHIGLKGRRKEFHHIVEANDGGDATLENCRVLCRACHAPLTKAYTQELRKAERIRDKNTGAFQKSRHRIRGGRWDTVKIKISREVVPRESAR